MDSMCAPHPDFGTLVGLLAIAGFIYFITWTQGEPISFIKLFSWVAGISTLAVLALTTACTMGYV